MRVCFADSTGVVLLRMSAEEAASGIQFLNGFAYLTAGGKELRLSVDNIISIAQDDQAVKPERRQ